MNQQELIAISEEVFYDAAVTADELWRAVGESLLLERTRRRWNASDVERVGSGLTYKTVQAIERGRVGRVEKLTAYAEALELSIVDVLRSVLAEAPLSPEAAQLLRKYERTTLEGRTAMTALALALPDAKQSPKGK